MDNALREILGTHVEQKGSFVNEAGLRFDFSHFEKLSDEQIREVESRVNSLIRADIHLEEKRDATMAQAKEMGAIALFGEKYGDKVRVVKFGPSVELCGGCHASSTGRIGFFKIVSESAIAAGVRRIEAITGESAQNYVNSLQDTLKQARAAFNNTQDLVGVIGKLLEENALYKKQAAEYALLKAKNYAAELASKACKEGDVNLIEISSCEDSSLLREAATLLQKSSEKTVLVAAYQVDGKPQLALMYSSDLVGAGKNAGKDIREAAKLILGGGGGQPGLATAGGKEVKGLAEALETLKKTALR